MLKRISALLISSSLLLPAIAQSADDEVVVYSSRKAHLIEPLFEAYEKKTGVNVRFITDKAAPLIARLQAEGERSPADMLITVDAGNLWQAANKGVLASVESEQLESNVPQHLQDPQNRWFGLSVRSRTMVYSTERVQPSELSSYEDLADPKWKGRLCLRTSKKVYNQSLVAMMIARHGEAKTQQIIQGWVANLATKPFSNDTKAMKAVAAGQCDVTIVNTYYFGRLQKKDPNAALAIFWPNQPGSAKAGQDTGVHVNISGAGITQYAPHRAAAVKLLEWLSSDEAQQSFAGRNQEYPVNPVTKLDPQVASWGTFIGDSINVIKAGELQTTAVKLMDRAGYK
ncbi:extracellular solute-binding protein [Pelagibaculum spongiae]|uniref:Fe(3+) ABC transporter substrate-binding protein n=1 Tax=Pelagibaculum spongiae TaxID=2080658 RepID=A0A2V1GQZ8_9GAMM|nr:extracellular solute-binding protein [Pelagibaculum spongiae]PVZ66421.1 Fe(3+) ABC transporter substrate-binding protein [Pelagibaculum spongiae]